MAIQYRLTQRHANTDERALSVFPFQNVSARLFRISIFGFRIFPASLPLQISHCAPNASRYFRALSKKQNIMAEVANKYPENVTGTFYVDDQCIDCDLCRETAPANFTRNDDGGHS